MCVYGTLVVIGGIRVNLALTMHVVGHGTVARVEYSVVGRTQSYMYNMYNIMCIFCILEKIAVLE